MSSGLAVVATNNGGTREVIRHGENGFLHEPSDVDGMVASVAGLLDAPGTLEDVERAARRTAEGEFQVDVAVDRYGHAETVAGRSNRDKYSDICSASPIASWPSGLALISSSTAALTLAR